MITADLWHWKILIALRFFLTCILQTGYLHPDEFFQSSEVIAGDIFGLKVVQPWEFNHTMPLRSIAFPYLTVGLPFTVLEMIGGRKVMGSRIFPYFLILLPRLFMASISLIHDWCLYKVCSMMKENYVKCLIVFASSYVSVVYYTRTLSNAIESVIFSFLLYIVASEIHRHILHDENMKFGDSCKQSSIKVSQKDLFSGSSTIGILMVLGFFNRPTFMFFAIPPVLFWIQCGVEYSYKSYAKCCQRIMTLIPSAVITASSLIVMDTVYYKNIPLVHILNYEESVIDNLKSMVYTPLNFIQYNLNTSNLQLHGLHPYYLHLAVNVPLLFGILGVYGLFYYFKTLINLVMGKWTKEWFLHIDNMMIVSFIFPVLLLSLFPHQEPRFIIPILFPLSYLCAKYIIGCSFKKKFMFVLWLISNILSCYFFGFVHQGGLIPCLLSLHSKIQTIKVGSQVNMVFYHTYMPPQHLLSVFPSDAVHVYDLAGQNETILSEKINHLNMLSSNSTLFIVAPGTLSYVFCSLSQNLKYRIVLVEKFFPHFASEDLNFYKKECCPLVCNSKDSLLDNVINKFSLHLYEVHSILEKIY